jgi:peptidoglycan/LPS O-acetylase OafA/YrhL
MNSTAAGMETRGSVMTRGRAARRGKPDGSATSRLACVDGVRGAAICMVLSGHLVGFAGLLTRSDLYASLFGTPIHVLWDETAAVQIFFVLSGFVLRLGLRHQISKVVTYRFLISRSFRLYPLYVIGLVFALACRRLWAGHDDLVAFNPELTIFWNQPTNWAELLAHLLPLFPTATVSGINAVLWSIFVEFKFSLIFPVIALSVLYVGDRALPFLLLLTGSLVYSWTAPQGSAGHYLFHFVLGAALAETWPRWGGTASTPWNIAGAAVAIWIMELRYAAYLPRLEQPHHDLLCAIGGGLLLCCAIRSPALNRLFSAPWLVWLGRRTYGIYLFHLPILLVAISWFTRRFAGDRLLVWFLAAVSTVLFSVLLSALCYRWIEERGNLMGKALATSLLPSETAERKQSSAADAR